MRGTGIPARRLLLVDNELKGRVGHNLPYAASLRAEAMLRGWGFQTFVHASCDPTVAAEVNGVPTFQQGVHEWFSPNPYPYEWHDVFFPFDALASNAGFLGDLAGGILPEATTNDIVLLPNATERHLLGVAALLHRIPKEASPTFILLFRYALLEPSTCEPFADRKFVVNDFKAQAYGWGFERIAKFVSDGRVRLVSDSERLAEEYASAFNVPVGVVPIPHAEMAVPPHDPIGPVPSKQPGTIRVVFLGDSRIEKGVHLLPALVEAFRVAPPSRRVEFVFQAFIGSQYHETMRPHIDALVRSEAPGLVLIGTPLSSDDYARLAASADLTLIPYDPMTYRARTSGPFVESLCLGKPVVTTRGSWMDGELSKTGGRKALGIVFDYDRPSTFIEAVRIAISRIDELAVTATSFGEEYRIAHSPSRFLDALTATAPSGATPRTEVASR